MSKVTILTLKERSQTINRASLINAAINLFIGITKVLLSVMTGSIAIATDSILNFGDTLSGLVTYFGNKLTQHAPTQKHPFGFGRIEYLSTIIASAVIIVLGIEFGRISIDHIIKPIPVHVNWFQILILIFLVLLKFYLYKYNKKAGEETNCEALKGVSHDSFIDGVGTSLTVLCILIDHFIPLDLDGWIGLGVSVFVILSSCSDIYETVNIMLGTLPNPQLIDEIKKTALSVPQVEGVSHIIIHSYGYYVHYGQMDVNLPDNLDVRQASKILQELENKLVNQFNIAFTFGLWPENLSYQHAIHEFRATDKGISITKKLTSTQKK